MDTINIGMLGAGFIANKMAATLEKMTDVGRYAVAARDGQKAKAFADKYGFAKSYGSYKEMLDDPAVTLVYVSTPNSHHYEHVKLCLEHGKHVLCEKPFTTDAKQAAELLELARSKKLLLTEAMWTRYLPFFNTIREVLDDGAIGEVSGLTVRFGNNVIDRPRIYDPALGGGALLDLTVYTLNFAAIFFGLEYRDMAASCTRYRTGVDAQNCLTLTYASERMAVLYSSVVGTSEHQATIYGDKGYMVLEKVNNPLSAQVFSNDWKPGEIYRCPPQITGFEYQVEASIRAIRNGATECPEMPHRDILRVMQILDSLRAQWGIVFPWEK